jgi:hypothetical protein
MIKNYFSNTVLNILCGSAKIMKSQTPKCEEGAKGTGKRKLCAYCPPLEIFQKFVNNVGKFKYMVLMFTHWGNGALNSCPLFPLEKVALVTSWRIPMSVT